MEEKMDLSLIAPCGMNCGTCLAYLREKNKCPGCRNMGKDGGSHYCRLCIIKNCQYFKTSQENFCFSCPKYPCKRLKALDKRYTLKYNMSMLENQKAINNLGLDKFVENETQRWTCKSCGKTLCVHRNFCLFCKNIKE